jgi:hypothetical protein
MATCVNCRQEINALGMVCPFCHTNPYWYGSQPYSGIDPQMFDGDAGVGCGVIVGVLGLICLFVWPIVGGVVLGSSIVFVIWRVKNG